MKKICCEQMELAVTNEDNPIGYDPIFREYYIRFIYNRVAGKRIGYCPWCASALPLSLRDAFFDIIESEYDIEDGIPEIFENKNLPGEFKSDAWWIKRGL